MRCTAKAKTTGEQCKNAPVTGYEVCRMHGVNRGTPSNSHAVTHGAYETLMRERLPEGERAAFDAVSTEATLVAELRILRYKMLRLLGDVDQNVVAGFNVQSIKADEPTKISGIVSLADSIRKMVKDMQGGDLSREMEGFLAGVQTVKEMQEADLSE